MKNPIISVVTVVYNGANLLEKTLQSVILQNYESIEYIIIDGGSTDGSLEIIKKYNSKISKWISEKDDGIYSAMNKGIRMVSGDWVCFLNCGDVFVNSDVVAIVATEIKNNHKNADIVYGNIYVEKKNGELVERVAKAPCNLHRMYFCHQSTFTKSTLLRKCFFDEQYKMSADFNFFKLCYRANYKFIHLNIALVIYDTSGISNKDRERGLLDNISVIRNVDKGFEKYKFLLRLYFTIYWRRMTKRNKHENWIRSKKDYSE